MKPPAQPVQTPPARGHELNVTAPTLSSRPYSSRAQPRSRTSILTTAVWPVRRAVGVLAKYQPSGCADGRACAYVRRPVNQSGPATKLVCDACGQLEGGPKADVQPITEAATRGAEDHAPAAASRTASKILA